MRLLQLVEELEEGALRNRNTWFVAEYDVAGRVLYIEKRVYGEIEMTHDYEYAANGTLARATIHIGDDDPQIMELA